MSVMAARIARRRSLHNGEHPKPAPQTFPARLGSRVDRSGRARRGKVWGRGSGSSPLRTALTGSDAHGVRRTYEPRVRTSPPGTWTDERIVAALRDWFDTFGATPLSYEWTPRGLALLGLTSSRAHEWVRQHPRWPSTATVCKHFGRWARAVEAANLPPARAIAPGRGFAERVEAARRLNAGGLGVSETAALLDVSPRTVRNYLRAGSCSDCGTPVITSVRCRRCTARLTRRSEWSPAEVRRALHRWVAEEGRVPTVGDWTPTADGSRKWAREYPRWPSFETVRTLFGGWASALEAAGLRSRRRRWSRGAIVVAFREFHAEHGRSPARADLGSDDDLPAPGTIRARYGSMQRALEAANLPVQRRHWSRTQIIGALLRHAERHGRWPSARDWRRATDSHPHATTVRQQFGSWAAAVAAAGGLPAHSDPARSARAS